MRTSRLAVVFLGGAATAQTQWEEFSGLHLPPIPTATRSLAVGDVDGDGRADLIVGTTGQNRLLRNSGDAIFADATASMPTRGGATNALALFDADGDTDLDLVTVNGSEVLHLDRNDGAGNFVAAAGAFNSVPAITTSVAVGDVDGDGDFDVFVGANQSWDLLYLNDGTGAFRDGTTGAQLPRVVEDTQCVALFDMDGDGDLDLFVGVSNGQNRLYRNSGAGVFTNVTANLPAGADTIRGVEVGDFDGDLDLDMMSADSQDRLWLNDGSGVFADATGARMPSLSSRTNDVRAADLDNDGDLDAVLANSSGPDILLRNDNGTFVDATAAAWATGGNSSVADVVIADFDGDGWLDVLFGTQGFPAPATDRLLLNQQNLQFLDASQNAVSGEVMFALGVAAGDLDGDGATDVFQVGRGLMGRGSAAVFLNDRHGRFESTPGLVPPANADLSDVQLADVDGDGDLDALISGNDSVISGSRNSLYLNDGTGAFTDATAAQMPGVLDEAIAIAAGDVDGDGDIDAVLGISDFFSGGQNRLLLNDGAGTFRDATGSLPVISDFTVEVLLEDFDGDGDLDLYVANSGPAGGRTDRLHQNDGSGNFTDVSATNLPPLTGTVRGAAACDIDDDGDVDVFCAIGLSGAGGLNRLLRNDGTGVFTDVSTTQLPAIVANSFEVACVDAELDGDVDILVVNLGPNADTTFYENDGSGTFVDGGARLPEFEAELIAPLDADGDRDVDLFIPRWGSVSGLQANRLRQLDTPYRARLGQTFAIDLHAVGWPATQVGFWATGVPGSPSTANLPFPTNGTLWLDLSTPVDLSGVLTVAPGAGLRRSEFPVPNSPALLGITVGIQALYLDGATSRWQFSNFLRDSITR